MFCWESLNVYITVSFYKKNPHGAFEQEDFLFYPHMVWPSKPNQVEYTICSFGAKNEEGDVPAFLIVGLEVKWSSKTGHIHKILTWCQFCYGMTF